MKVILIQRWPNVLKKRLLTTTQRIPQEKAGGSGERMDEIFVRNEMLSFPVRALTVDGSIVSRFETLPL